MRTSTMDALFSRDFAPLWALVLALALFLPVRRLIFALTARRAAAKGHPPDEAEQKRLLRRAGVTAALLCFVFSMLYSYHRFSG